MAPLIVGTLAIDTLEFSSHRVEDSFGGSASFSSVAASFFGPVRLVAAVGDDFPQPFRELLVGRGVDLSGVVSPAGATMFRWRGRYQENLNIRETVEMHLGVLEHYLPDVPAQFADSRHVLLANMPPAKQLRVLDQLAGRSFVLCDTIDDWVIAHRGEVIEVLNRVDVMMMNDSEVKLLAGDDDVYRAGRWVREQGAKSVIVKRGEHGCVLFDEAGPTALPAYPTEQVIDPTGAGDSFAGGILGYLGAQNEEGPTALRRAVVQGTAIASLTVEGYGLEKLKAANRQEIDDRCDRYLRMLRID